MWPRNLNRRNLKKSLIENFIFCAVFFIKSNPLRIPVTVYATYMLIVNDNLKQLWETYIKWYHPFFVSVGAIHFKKVKHVPDIFSKSTACNDFSKLLQRDSNPQRLSLWTNTKLLTKLAKWLSCVVRTYLYDAMTVCFCQVTYPAAIYLLKINNRNMFKVNNKDTKVTPLASFWCLYC